MFVEKFQTLSEKKTQVDRIFFVWIKRRVDILIRATRVTLESKKKRQEFIHLFIHVLGLKWNSEFKKTLDILQEELLSVF